MPEGAAHKLPFHVVHATSEDPDYPATELNYHGPTTKGWLSARYCDWPQDVGLQFDEGMCSCVQIQLLSHQYAIATKIELFTGIGDSYATAKWKRLGYLSLDSNKQSNYRARELKSVYVDAKGQYIKLVMHRCYSNEENLMNQVGIVAISFLGSVGGTAPARGAASHRRVASGESAAGGRDLGADMRMDPDTAAKLAEVVKLKADAVAAEDYATAKLYKDVETRIRASAAKLAELHARKQAAVKAEDFDLAKHLKDEITALRREIIGANNAPVAAPHHHGGAPPHGGGYDQDPHGGHAPMSAAAAPSYRSAPRGHPDDRGHHGYDDHRGGYDDHRGGHEAGYDDHGRRGGEYGRAGDEGYNRGYDEGEAGQEQRTHHHSPRYSQREDYAPSARGGPSPRHAAAAPGSPQRGGSPGFPANNNGGHAGYDNGSPHAAPAASSRHQEPASGAEAIAAEMERPLPGARNRNIYEQAAQIPGAESARPESRAIKPAGRGLGDFDDDDEAAGFGGVSAARPSGPTADVSQLAGVPGAADLPAPEALTEAKRTDAAELIEVCGEYVASCIMSKQFKLRQAGVLKLQLEMAGYSQPPAVVAAAVLKVVHMCTTKEKIAQVFLNALGCVKPVVKLCSSLRKAELLPLLEPVAVALVDKLGDNNARCRDATFAMLGDLSHSPSVGAPFISAMLLRKFKKKQLSAWKPLKTRLELLTQQVEMYGLGKSSGLGSDALVKFIVDTKACEHPHGEVREAAKLMCVEVYKRDPSLLGQLSFLRKQQLAEYQAAFDAGGVPAKGPARAAPAAARAAPGSGAGAAGSGNRRRSGAGRGSPKKSARGGRKQQERSPAPAPAAAKEEEEPLDDEEGADDECQFCGVQFPPGLDEKQVEMHYWNECPFLTQCTACEQVIEISTLNDHMLVECDHQAKFKRCDRCGEAIAESEMAAHSAAAACTPAKSPDVANRCPLCHEDVEPEQEGWLVHLLDNGCPANPRKPLKQ